MRPGSHADSLRGPLWNSNWSQIEPTHFFFYPQGEEKKHTSWIGSQQCLQSATYTSIFIGLWGKFEVLCTLSLDKSGPQNISQIVISICFHRTNGQTQAKAEVLKYTYYVEKNVEKILIRVITDTLRESALRYFLSTALHTETHK